MAARPKRTGNWTPDGKKADRAAERREFLETTPGQRVEQAIELSSVLSQLAAGAQSRRLRELREEVRTSGGELCAHRHSHARVGLLVASDLCGRRLHVECDPVFQGGSGDLADRCADDLGVVVDVRPVWRAMARS